MENEDKFICPFPGCSRVFQKRWSLTRHCRKHTGEKPFRCSKCNKEFVEKCGLVRHEQTHTDERHWECDVLGCKKKFKLKEYLDIHKKTWHAKNDVNVNNDFTLRSLTETSGANDTTDQLRQRLVRMSLRHREVIYAQQQRESELLSKLRACSHYLQNSLTMITFDTQEKKAFKTNVSKFLNETIALGSEDTDSSDSHDDIMISNGQQLPLPLPQLPHSQPQQHQQQYLNSHQIVPNENLLPLNHNNLINRADLSIAEYLAHQLGDNNQIYCSEDPNKFLDYQSQNHNHNHQQPQQQTQQQQQYALEFYSNTSSTNDLLGDHNNFFEVLSPESKRHGDWDDSNLYHLRKKQHFDNNENLDQYQTHNNSILSHSNSLPLPTQLTTSISSSSSNCPFNDFTTMLESTSSILTNDNNHQNQNYNHNYNHNLYSDSFHPISSLSISSHNTNFHNNNNHHHNHNHNHNQVSSSCESPTDSIGYSSAKQYSVSNPSSPTTSVSSQQSSLYSKLSSGIPPSLTIPQTCSISNGPLACLPNSANGILDVMFTLSSEVTPSTSVNGITSSQSQHMYSNHIPLNSYPGLSISSSSLSIPTSVLSQSNTLLSSSSSSLSPLLSSKSTSSSSMLLNSGQSINSTISTNDNMATASSSSSHSTNIADVMAWIKNNPLKTTKRYN